MRFTACGLCLHVEIHTDGTHPYALHIVVHILAHKKRTPRSDDQSKPQDVEDLPQTVAAAHEGPTVKAHVRRVLVLTGGATHGQDGGHLLNEPVHNGVHARDFGLGIAF